MFLINFLLDLKPVFTTGPQQVNNSLHGCQFKSKYSLENYTYWWVNDSIQIKANVQTINTSLFTFQPLSIQPTFDAVQYRCVIYDPQRMRKPVTSEQMVVVKEGKIYFSSQEYQCQMTVNQCSQHSKQF